MLRFFGKRRFFSFTVLLQVHTFQILNKFQATSFSKGAFLMHKNSEWPCRFIPDHLGEKLNGLENYQTISWTKWAFWSLKQEGNEKSLSNQIRYLPLQGKRAMEMSISSIIPHKLWNGSHETLCRCFCWYIKCHQNSMKSMSSKKKIDTSYTTDIINIHIKQYFQIFSQTVD